MLPGPGSALIWVPPGPGILIYMGPTWAGILISMGPPWAWATLGTMPGDIRHSGTTGASERGGGASSGSAWISSAVVAFHGTNEHDDHDHEHGPRIQDI